MDKDQVAFEPTSPVDVLLRIETILKGRFLNPLLKKPGVIFPELYRVKV